MGRFLVTGGAGFIGSHLTEALLAQGHAVFILDNLSTGRMSNVPAGAEMMVGDIRDARLVTEMMRGMNGCFHLAAVASVQACTDDWAGAHSTNQTGAISVFDAAWRVGGGDIPVVYASSAAVYGDNQNCPLSESERPRPLSAYGADKYGCELHATAAARVHRLPSIGMRFFNVYGPRQDPASPYSGVISIFCDRLLNGRGVRINGDGGQTCDFVYVGDVCAALTAAMSHCTQSSELVSKVMNVCTGQEVSVLQLAQTIASLTGGRPDVEFGPERKGDIRRSLGDPASLAQLLPYGANTTLKQGLERTLDWMMAERAAASEALAPIASEAA